jgi:hypothetical protein
MKTSIRNYISIGLVNKNNIYWKLCFDRLSNSGDLHNKTLKTSTLLTRKTMSALLFVAPRLCSYISNNIFVKFPLFYICANVWGFLIILMNVLNSKGILICWFLFKILNFFEVWTPIDSNYRHKFQLLRSAIRLIHSQPIRALDLKFASF